VSLYKNRLLCATNNTIAACYVRVGEFHEVVRSSTIKAIFHEKQRIIIAGTGRVVALFVTKKKGAFKGTVHYKIDASSFSN